MEDKRRCIEPEHPQLSIDQQCDLLELTRSSYYYQPQPEIEENLKLMRRLDELCLQHPYYGSRRLAAALSMDCEEALNRKRVQRLMRLMGLEVLYPKRNLSRPAPGHEIYPYLLRGVAIERVNQVWSSDITYIPLRRGFLYLTAVMDWRSRFVLSWELSNTLDGWFCRSALEAAFGWGRPEIFNSDQGSQFTAREYLQLLKDRDIRISMDGRGRALDNVFIERLWRSVKYELIYPGDFSGGDDLSSALRSYFDHYNHRRPHQALGYTVPAKAFGQRA